MKDTVSQRITGLAALAALLVLGFGQPLCQLVKLAWHSDLFSHILLIPFISAYLVSLKRHDLALESPTARGWAVIPLLLGAGLLAAHAWAARAGWKPKPDNYVALMTLSFLLFLCAGGFLFLGLQTVRRVAFPAAFLIFMVPFPVVVRQGIESFFQHGSAATADLLFRVSGMPFLRQGTECQLPGLMQMMLPQDWQRFLRQGTEFQLPGFSLEVAPQCSGIHSSLVLFITSLAGRLFVSEVALAARRPRARGHPAGAGAQRLPYRYHRPALRPYRPAHDSLPHPPSWRSAFLCLIPHPVLPDAAPAPQVRIQAPAWPEGGGANAPRRCRSTLFALLKTITESRFFKDLLYVPRLN